MAAAGPALLLGAVVAAAFAVDAAASTPSAAFAVQLEKRADPSRRRLGATVGAVEVADCENVEYTGMIGLGTPIQEFRVVLSIATSYVWVVNTDCMFCATTSGGYDSSLSSTHEVDGRGLVIPDESGKDATGILSVDVLSVGGISTAITFGEMTEANLEGCVDVDGVMGMGLTNEAENNAFEDMVDNGAVEVPIFSFFMGNIDTDSPNGVLTLGGVNQTHYEGCLEWMPVSEAQDGTSDMPGFVPDGFWSVVLKDLKVGSDSMISSEATAVLDTGSSLIAGPFDEVGAIAAKIGAVCVRYLSGSESSAEYVDCAKDASDVQLLFLECEAEFDDINFYFGGEDFALTAKELLQPITDFAGPNPNTAADPYCLFGMAGADLTDTWILGDPFLRTFYTSYNVADKTVGLARATNGRTSSECAADASISTGTANAADGDGDGDSSSSSADGDELGGPTTARAGTGSSSSNSGAGDAEGLGGEQTSLVAVGVAAGLAAMGLISCAVVVFAVRQRFSKGGGAYRPAVDDIDDVGGGGGGGGFEMSSAGSSSMAARHGGEATEREGDFLQASPRTGVARGRGGTGTTAAVFGRLLGGPPARAGFAAFENAD